MSTSISAPASGSLVFNWDARWQRNLPIAGFVTASVAAHAGCFYLFQVVYPPTVALLPRPARVNLISSNSEEGRTLLRWVDAEDPALAATTRRPPDAKPYVLPKVQHVPSYFATEPALKEAPPLVVDLRSPIAQPSGMVPVTRRPRAQTMGLAPTTVTFSKEIEELGPPRFPPANFKASTAEAPQSARLYIAVSRTGEIRYCFPLSSSGDAALDEQARSYLALCRFPPSPAMSDRTLVWGIASVEWGNDIVHSGQSSTTTAP